MRFVFQLSRPALAALSVGTLFVLDKARRACASSRVIELPTVHIYGSVNGAIGAPEPLPTEAERRPLSISFTLRVSALEKQLLPLGELQMLAEQYAQSPMFGGLGAAAVKVTDRSAGYYVSVAYPDSANAPSAVAVQDALETLDPRLKGRIANVVVAR